MGPFWIGLLPSLPRPKSGPDVVCRSHAFEVRGVIEGWVTRGAEVAECSTYKSYTIRIARDDMHCWLSQLTAAPSGMQCGITFKRPKLARMICRTFPPLHCIDKILPSQTTAVRPESTCDTTTGAESNL